MSKADKKIARLERALDKCTLEYGKEMDAKKTKKGSTKQQAAAAHARAVRLERRAKMSPSELKAKAEKARAKNIATRKANGTYKGPK